MKRFAYILLYSSIAIFWALTACSAVNDSKLRTHNIYPSEKNWKNLGLYSGQINLITPDPLFPVTYAGTAGGDGLYIKSNSKNTWEPVLTGAEGTELEGEATFRNTTVWAVEFTAAKAITMWVLHDFWVAKSAPGSWWEWEHIDIQQRLKDCDKCDDKTKARRVCRSLAIDPTNPARVYVGTSGPPELPESGAIYRTENGGGEWQKLGTGPNGADGFIGTVTKILINPYDTTILYAVANSEDPEGKVISSLYYSTNSGDTWDSLRNSVTLRIYDLQLLALDRKQIKFFIATEKGLYSNFNFFNDFQQIKGLGDEPILSMAFDPRQPGLMYASVAGKGLARGIFDPKDKTVTFEKPSGKGNEFISLGLHPESENKLFCGDIKRGVFQAEYIPGPKPSDSGKFAYSLTTNGINARNVHDLDVIPAAGADPTYLIAATNSGAAIREGDNEWQLKLIDSLPSVPASAAAFDDRFSDGSNFYVGGEGYLAHTTDWGKSWQINDRDIPSNMQVSDIAIAGDGLTLFVATRGSAQNSGRIYRSIDGGENLKEVYRRDEFDINSIMIDPHDPAHIIAGGGNYDSSGHAGAYIESVNGGYNWTDTGLPGVVVNAVLIDPENPAIMYAGCGNQDGAIVPLYRTTDRGESWQPSYEGIVARPRRYGIWGSAAEIVHVLGHTGSIIMGGLDDRRILHFDGKKPPEEKDSGVFEHLNGIWGQGPNDIFAVGNRGAIVHYSGQKWSAMEAEKDRTTGRDLYAIWGRSGSDVSAVGQAGTFLHFDGNHWSDVPTPAKYDFYGVWSDAEFDHTYMVGSNGTILDYFNGQWISIPRTTNAQLNGIWGMPGGKTVFVVGAPREDDQQKLHYTIIRYNGLNWSPMETAVVEPGRGKLNGVWGTSATNVFAVGDDGIILHYDGKLWTPMDSGTTANLYAVWGYSSNSVYVVGSYGTILFHDGKQWIKVDQDSNGQPVERMTKWNAVTDLTFYAADVDSHLIYASTARQGVLSSTDQGGTWINLSAPPYPTVALGVGSVTAAGSGAYSPEPYYISGLVRDKRTLARLRNAKIRNLCQDDGLPNIPCFPPAHSGTNGAYALILKAGEFTIKASLDDYLPIEKSGIKPKKEGRTVNFNLKMRTVKVFIDNSETDASGGVFSGGNGTVKPVSGDHRWSDGSGRGYLEVPYPDGSVTLKITPKQNFEIEHVQLNTVLLGANTSHTLSKSNLRRNNNLSVNFKAVTPACPGDSNDDGDVDGADLEALADGSINVGLPAFTGNFGSPQCP